MLASRHGESVVVALLNRSDSEMEARLRAPISGTATRSRIYPEMLPTDGHLPAREEESVNVEEDGFALRLRPHELTVVGLEERG